MEKFVDGEEVVEGDLDQVSLLSREVVLARLCAGGGKTSPLVQPTRFRPSRSGKSRSEWLTHRQCLHSRHVAVIEVADLCVDGVVLAPPVFELGFGNCRTCWWGGLESIDGRKLR